MAIEDMHTAWQEHRLSEVLLSNTDALTKVREIMGLGFSEERADEIVEQYQMGQQSPVYYERLEFDAGPDFAPDDRLSDS